MTGSPSPLVLVHGFYHGSWCWSEVVLELAASGRIAVAVDVAGHGLRARLPHAANVRPFDSAAFASEPSPIAEAGLDAAADLLIEQITRVGHGAPVTVVAHSMGGAVLTRAAEQAPQLMAHLVYLTAYMPASGVPCIAYPSLPEARESQFMPLLAGDPLAIGAMRVDTGTDDPRLRAGIRQAFYGDVDEHVAAAATALLSCDAPTAMATESTTLTQSGWGSIGRTFVTCSQDRTIPLALQRLFITQADEAFPANPTRVVELECSHAPFLSMPGKVAEIVATLP
ncbi:alpha/beta fold hydrolase [Amycolatopsis dongchuanensis]|uniref:Alpha/beta hydrolase n=1 Tax=Amycolatopsis dongchuanensis TaxID=1070866 RepID=A0ABP8VFL5_9PSEU